MNDFLYVEVGYLIDGVNLTLKEIHQVFID